MVLGSPQYSRASLSTELELAYKPSIVSAHWKNTNGENFEIGALYALYLARQTKKCFAWAVFNTIKQMQKHTAKHGQQIL